jgi:hypothetical protein
MLAALKRISNIGDGNSNRAFIRAFYHEAIVIAEVALSEVRSTEAALRSEECVPLTHYQLILPGF